MIDACVFDLEIKNPVEGLSKKWSSHDEMGISVLCLFDYKTMRYRVFDDSTMGEALDILFSRKFVAGFNTVNFDWKVLSFHETFGFSRSPQYTDFDILREIWIAKGLDPDRFDYRTHGGYKLDDVAGDTLGIRKSGNGAFAPILYQTGRLGELYDYVIQDVKVEKELFEFAVKYEYVVRGNQIIHLNVPEQLKEMFQ